ncbi:hypothetical protein [Acidicapsa acidisoli]|uniref:hypothetical protein n=1 Tax=Acidicapsa acidisoli TaxID=1615681 RepID=UPI0021E018DC|nr:hypothetical protein [Acidicapsa acidisoli]
MSHQVIARALLALLSGVQGLATLGVDLNRTHATNPSWTRHARFHLVWQASSCAFLSGLGIVIVLLPGPYMTSCFYIAAAMAAIPMVSCLSAFLTRRLYGGALFDPNGIPPVTVRIFARARQIDINLATEIVALGMLSGIVAIFRYR